MQSASLLDDFAFDLLSFLQDGRPVSEVGIGAREVVQALVVAPGVVVLDEVDDGAFEISGWLVFFEQDAALQSTVKNSQADD
jgi:hypothetical protein